MNKTAKKRRETLFRKGKPDIRPAIYEDIRWLWAAAKRGGFDGTSEEFTIKAEPFLAEADRVFMFEDRNSEFDKGRGPVGIVLCNYDGWSLLPHIEWFPWTTAQNRLRCTVAFLHSMRYTKDVGMIKVMSSENNEKWFKRLKRYVAINLAGRIPHGRSDGMESIFYLRGRKQHDYTTRREPATKGRRIEPSSGSSAKVGDSSGERVTH